MRVRVLVIVAVLVVVLGSVVSDALSRSDSSAMSPKIYKLTKKDSGRTLAVHVGDRISISLSYSSGTGYHWTLTRKPRATVLRLDRVWNTIPKHPPGFVGYPVFHHYLFRAVARGSTAVKVSSSPPGNRPPADAFSIRVEVG